MQQSHNIYKFILGEGFQYQKEELSNFYLCLKAKPFVILAGISGTGKTQLPRKFAEAIGMKKEQVIQLAVRPDWTDGSDLIGYASIDGNFMPKELTIAIQKAIQNPELPYFFILDEMNLARVEYYFSDFLSVIETRTWDKQGIIVTDHLIKAETLKNTKNSNDFKAFGWPENLFLIGTVNMDETTHPFSRKVLDRANSIEMNEVDLEWLNSSEKVEPLPSVSNSFFKSAYLSSYDLSEEEKASIRKELDLLIKVNSILQEADLKYSPKTGPEN